MTENDLRVLQNFPALWARISGTAVQLPASDVDADCILQCLYAAKRGYHTMAKCAPGEARCRLKCMEQETSDMIRCLQAGRFLTAGDTYAPSEKGEFCKFTATDLQKLWKKSRELETLSANENLQADWLTDSDLKNIQQMAQCHKLRIRQLLMGLL